VRCAFLFLFFCVFLFTFSVRHASASHQKLTDAELDGFKGQVKSVFTTVDKIDRHPGSADACNPHSA
jgi:molybdopterin/thiamine biosynthesis adenylyltransferase